MKQVLEHKHIIIRAEILEPPTDVDIMNQWMKDLVDVLGMKLMMGPWSAYSEMEGNKGLTSAAIIETSHIVSHFWDEVNPGLAQIDIYTCSSLELNDVLEAISIFKPIKVEYILLDRENNLEIMKKDIL